MEYPSTRNIFSLCPVLLLQTFPAQGSVPMLGLLLGLKNSGKFKFLWGNQIIPAQCRALGEFWPSQRWDPEFHLLNNSTLLGVEMRTHRGSCLVPVWIQCLGKHGGFWGILFHSQAQNEMCKCTIWKVWSSFKLCDQGREMVGFNLGLCGVSCCHSSASWHHHSLQKQRNNS